MPTLRIAAAAFAVLLALSKTVAALPAETPERSMVEGYLRALAAFDHEKAMSFVAADAITLSADGRESQVDRDQQRQYREFERAVHTVWKWSIAGVDGEEVAVLLTEKNDFYDLLGVGTRTQITLHGVRNGKIVRIETKAAVHEYGTYLPAFRRFRTWLVARATPPDPELFDTEGGLVFDGKSAPKMLTWLHRFREETAKHP